MRAPNLGFLHPLFHQFHEAIFAQCSADSGLKDLELCFADICREKEEEEAKQFSRAPQVRHG
jgi:hypothetical protein